MTDHVSAWQPDEQDRAFCDVYGDWDPLTPAEAADALAGFSRPWWVVGGYAIEAFTGVRRAHEDLDVVVFNDAVGDLRAQLGHRFHLWSNDGGTFRIIDDDHPEPLDPLSQIWMRKDARSPWQIDCILNPVDGRGRWVSRRDPSHVAELDEVTWVAQDGIRYLRPEVALLFKARHRRVKDDVDLEATLPLLPAEQRAWLREGVARLHGEDHPWVPRLAPCGPAT